MNKILLETKQKENLKYAELDMLELYFGGQSKVADILRVDRSSVTQWRKGKVLSDLTGVKVAGITYIMNKLTTYFHRETALSWLEGINAHLGNKRPIDLLRSNRIAEVDRAIDQSLAGSYA